MLSPIKKYFIIVGGFVNFALAFGCVFTLYHIFASGLPLPVFADKIRENLSINKPNILFILAPALDLMSSFQEKNYYFKKVDLATWNGVGANKNSRFASYNKIHVHNNSELFSALKSAQPGQTIVLYPGVYRFEQNSIHIGNPGTKDLPILVMAEKLGSVKLVLRGEGFVVNKPYWQFRNLHLIGNCNSDSQCEHAFHVVGNGSNALIQNNIIQDFNAMIKINGFGKNYPDNGKIIQNTIFNTSPRNTTNPVTPIDLMHANNWLVAKNFIFDIQKSAGDKVSYAAFFKGGSNNGIFEQNLIMCAANLPDNYTSIGLSLGGGGSLKANRRDKNIAEHSNGIIRNNIIMHCANDVGIYLNRAANSQVYNNTLFNTQGIDARFPETSVLIARNVMSGRIKKRDGGKYTSHNNLVVGRDFVTGKDELSDFFEAPDIGNFNWVKNVDNKEKKNAEPALQLDFCGEQVTTGYIGAYAGEQFCVSKLNLTKQFQKDLH